MKRYLVQPGKVEEAACRAKGANALHDLAHICQGQDIMRAQGICNGPSCHGRHYCTAPGEDGQQGRLLHIHAVVLIVISWDPQEH